MNARTDMPTLAAAHTAMWNVALVGNPNCGKTALFNLLTGARQKVANYAGVTVERKIGHAHLANGQTLSIIDLPGTYSLTPASPDERVTLEVIEGRRQGEAAPDAIVAVVDATNLRMNLRLVLEIRKLGRPMIVAMNMTDVARANGLDIDVAKLSQELGCPVVETIAVKHNGHASLLAQLEAEFGKRTPGEASALAPMATPGVGTSADPILTTSSGTATTSFPTPADLQREVRRILAIAAPRGLEFKRFHERFDGVVMHPVWGLVILAVVLFLIFQAVFSWANVPMDLIKDGMQAGADWTREHMSDGPLRSLLVDGVIAGVGGVLAFLPQILILFFFILLLEDSGYLPRAAFLLDTLMGKVGLSGRAFIPLLSSFACAIPGIMATRSIVNAKDRLATIMIAPLMTCSARLPVYALLIGAFIPNRDVGPFNLRGITLFVLYAAGVVSAMGVAWVIKKFWIKSSYQPLMLELPPYRTPDIRNLAIGLWERAAIFVKRVGTIIFALMVVLWFLSSYPSAPEGATNAAITYSAAGWLGQKLQVIFAPIGFNWQISIALVPGMAAREVAVGALGTVYALSASDDAVAQALSPIIASGWTLATAYSLLAWFVFAPQCLSTLAVVRRETNSWRYPALMAAYLFALAYLASFITYHTAVWLGA